VASWLKELRAHPQRAELLRKAQERNYNKKLEMLKPDFVSVTHKPTTPIGDSHNAPVWEDYLLSVPGEPEV